MKVNTKSLLYFLSALFILTGRVWGTDVNIYIKYIISLGWVCYFAAVLIKFRNDRTKQFKRHFGLMMFPLVVMAGYALIIWFFSTDVTTGNYTRLASSLIYMCLAWSFAGIGYYLFQKKSIDYLFYAGIISYFFGSIVYLIYQSGISGILLYMRSLILGEDNAATHAMEVHDLTFAMGIFFLYYAFFEDKREKHHNAKIILSILMIFLGLKKIEIIALVIAVALYYFLMKRKIQLSYRTIILTILFLTISFGFVYIIDSGILDRFVLMYNIETSGRLGYYEYAKRYFDFSIGYTGMGFSYFNRMFNQLRESGFMIDGGVVASSIHSDILVLYIENGFILFTLWVIYSFWGKTKRLLEKNSKVVAECYLLISIYMFILYLTDNTFSYYDTQMLYFLAPLVLTGKNHITDSRSVPIKTV